MPGFHSLPLVWPVGVFVACALAVRAAGTRLSCHADAIPVRTDIGQPAAGGLALPYRLG